MNTYHLQILAPDKKIFDGKVVSTLLPGAAGFFEVLANHCPITCLLKPGKVTYKNADNKETTLTLDAHGFFEFFNNKALILLK